MRIQSATLHEALFVKFGSAGMSLGTVLGSDAMKSEGKNVTMQYGDGVLSVKSGNVTVLVPISNIKSMTAAPEEPAKEAKK